MNEAYDYAMRTAMEKQAGIKDILDSGLELGKYVGPILSGGLLLKSLYAKISNDIRRKSIIEDLSLNDPVLKNVGKAKLMEWYATIYHFSPKVSLDKTATADLLRNFASFNKVDMQSLKLLSETEKNLSPKPAVSPWAALLGD